MKSFVFCFLFLYAYHNFWMVQNCSSVRWWMDNFIIINKSPNLKMQTCFFLFFGPMSRRKTKGILHHFCRSLVSECNCRSASKDGYISFTKAAGVQTIDTSPHLCPTSLIGGIRTYNHASHPCERIPFAVS